MVFNKIKFIFCLALIDILFLPFLKPLPITISMLPVMFWTTFHFRRNTYDKCLITTFIFFSSLSLIYSFVFYPQVVNDGEADLNVWSQNIIFFGLLLLFFAYFIFFKNLIPRFGLRIYRYLLAYFSLLLLLSFYFFIDYKGYFHIRSFWTLSSSPLEVGDFSSMVRYTGMFSDPNNCAVMVVTLFTILVLYNKCSVSKFIFLTVACLFILITTMSSTGFLSFLIVVPFVVYRVIFNVSSSWQKTLIIGLILIFIISIFFAFSFVQNTEIGRVAFERLSGNSASTRFAKFEEVIGYEAIQRLFVGTGGTVIIGSDVVRPHIGHLHFFYNYGFLAYIAFILLVFRMRRGISFVYYLPLVPLFLGFSANTGFIDFRFSVISSLVLALYAINPQNLGNNHENTCFF